MNCTVRYNQTQLLGLVAAVVTVAATALAAGIVD